VSDLLNAQPDPSHSELVQTLRETDTSMGGEGWGLVAGLFNLGPGREDVALLCALGAVAAQINAPIVAGAVPAMFGCKSPEDLPDPLRWEVPDADAAERWSALRRSSSARWIGVIAPRLLLRLPYGKSTDALEHFSFEEQPATPEHETLLWGPGSLALPLLFGQAFAAGGWEQVANASLDVEDLPAYTFSRDGEPQLQPCAEGFVGERAGEVLLRLGLMPLLSHRGAARCRLMRIQSVAEPAQPLAGRWS
jgi:type VI secretion system protein ImpC